MLTKENFIEKFKLRQKVAKGYKINYSQLYKNYCDKYTTRQNKQKIMNLKDETVRKVSYLELNSKKIEAFAKSIRKNKENFRKSNWQGMIKTTNINNINLICTTTEFKHNWLYTYYSTYVYEKTLHTKNYLHCQINHDVYKIKLSKKYEFIADNLGLSIQVKGNQDLNFRWHFSVAEIEDKTLVKKFLIWLKDKKIRVKEQKAKDLILQKQKDLSNKIKSIKEKINVDNIYISRRISVLCGNCQAGTMNFIINNNLQNKKAIKLKDLKAIRDDIYIQKIENFLKNRQIKKRYPKFAQFV
jgi:hypothetical protein